MRAARALLTFVSSTMVMRCNAASSVPSSRSRRASLCFRILNSASSGSCTAHSTQHVIENQRSLHEHRAYVEQEQKQQTLPSMLQDSVCTNQRAGGTAVMALTSGKADARCCPVSERRTCAAFRCTGYHNNWLLVCHRQCTSVRSRTTCAPPGSVQLALNPCRLMSMRAALSALPPSDVPACPSRLTAPALPAASMLKCGNETKMYCSLLLACAGQ